jgi:hypothetical protein
MKIARVAGVVGVWALVTGCARSQQASAPAASSTASDFAAAPTEAAEEAPASAAPAPQGLDQAREPEANKALGLDDEFKNLESAEQALNQAKADLDRLALAQPAPVVGRSAASNRATEKKETKGAPPPAAGAAASASPNAVCENACRAFSSLSRAASAVCRLDSSSTGAHCSHAKRVVADSQQRIASCTCPAAKD